MTPEAEHISPEDLEAAGELFDRIAMEQKPRHTPGPWIYKEQGEANNFCLLSKSGNWIFGFIQNGEMHTPQQIANIRIMAAAPDLLQAAKNLIAQLRSEFGAHFETVELSEAIKKAELGSL